MNRSKKLYIMSGILAIVCVVTFCITKYEEKKEEIKNSDEVILELDSEKVTKLSWEYEEEAFAFHKDENWIYDEDEAFPVNEEKVNELLSIFESFGVSFIIENVEDYGQYGLDSPVCTIQIETEEENYEIKLGDYSTMDSERYVSVGDGNVYLVKEDPFESFGVALSDMILHDEIPSIDQAQNIQFSGEEEYQVDYEENSTETYCEEDVYFTEVNGTKKPLDTDNVDEYLQTISDLELTDYVTYNVSEEELETYGLNDPELSVSIQYEWEDEETEEMQEDTFVLHISRDPKERKEEASKDGKTSDDIESEEEEEEITAYARIGESKIIYKLDTDQYHALMKASYNDLRHQEVLSADFSDITKVDIVLEDKTYTITSKGSDDKEYYYGKEELDISDFQNALTGMEATDFTEEEPTQKEEISLTVYLENDNYPQVSITLYRYDGEHCLACLDGEPVSLVSRSDVVELIEAVNAIVLN